jgi:D-glycero-alpha-D-manno-heptose-7-phosphate kinase
MNSFLKINLNCSIIEALELIEKNNEGGIVLIDDNDCLIGIATDGDIRRHLLAGNSIESRIINCASTNCVFEYIGTNRDILLKKLDSKIRILPLVDNNKKLINVLTKNNIPTINEAKLYARSRAPVRISFGGGGSDLTHYFLDNKGAVINSTISLYTHTTLIVRDDHKVIIDSSDLNERGVFDNLKLFLEDKGKFGLIQSVIKKIYPTFGFELYINSDYPMSSGLGGSAVVAASIFGCFNEFRFDKWNKHEVSELAFEAERFILGISGGWQDQYATVFGGFNFMEFDNDQNVINPFRLNNETILELEESLLLCYTGITHDSGNIHNDQKEQTKNEVIKDRIKSNVDLTYEMRNYLLRGSLNEFGRCLHKAWELKRSFSSQISNPWLDEIYNGALQNGAIGGKILGAGGGGYFLFYVPSFDRHKLMDWISANGLISTPFIFENNGLQSWTVREN